MNNALRLAAVGLLLVACSKDSSKKAAPKDLGAAPPPATGENRHIQSGGDKKAEVVVSVTVDWEGAYLSEPGLEAMDGFRKDWPELPITHFLCPAYFLKKDAAKDTADRIKKHLRANDEVGLHIHPWFSLAKRAGVPPRKTPNFYHDDSALLEFDDGDQGYEVDLSAYDADELTKMIASSKALLAERGFGEATSFRAGGYAATPDVLAAAAANGLSADSSSTWSSWFEEGQGNFQAQLKKLWPDVVELSQPYPIKTASGTLVEVPNTGSFVEYATGDEMLGHLQRAAAQSLETGKAVYVDFGFHQETADQFIDRLGDALYNFKNENPGVLHFATVHEVAAKFRAP